TELSNNRQGIALNLESAKTCAVYIGDGFRCLGEVRFASGVVSGTVKCDRGKVVGLAGKPALTFDNAKTGPISMVGLHAEGAVVLFNAVVSGVVDGGGARFNNPGKIALSLENAKTRAVYLNAFLQANGEVLLRNAETGIVVCDSGI